VSAELFGFLKKATNGHRFSTSASSWTPTWCSVSAFWCRIEHQFWIFAQCPTRHSFGAELSTNFAFSLSVRLGTLLAPNRAPILHFYSVPDLVPFWRRIEHQFYLVAQCLAKHPFGAQSSTNSAFLFSTGLGTLLTPHRAPTLSYITNREHLTSNRLLTLLTSWGHRPTEPIESFGLNLADKMKADSPHGCGGSVSRPMIYGGGGPPASADAKSCRNPV